MAYDTAREWLVDANLLVLWVVGATDRSLIAKHKRLAAFDVEDYNCLVELVTAPGQVFVTPNTLTEASNLIGHHGEPERSQCLDMLAHFIEHSREVTVRSATAARNRHFRRLGLTDAVLLEVASPERPLLTVDLQLYIAASDSEPESAFNFRHICGDGDMAGALAGE